MGIHNEPGTAKLSLPKTADLVNEMLSKIVDTTDKDRSFVPFKNDGSDEVVLLVNNLGSISELELGGIVHECEWLLFTYLVVLEMLQHHRYSKHEVDIDNPAVSWLRNKKYTVRRVLAGTYMTSLNMPGFSLTLLSLPQGGSEPFSSQQILSWLDAPADAPGWKYYSSQEPGKVGEKAAAESEAPKAKEVDLAREFLSSSLPPTLSLKYECISTTM